jgi:hypothetical protein
MSSDMTPQINKAVSNYRALLESRGVKFPTDAFQSVLGNQAFATAQFELMRDYVEMSTGILVRDVTVDLSLTGMDAIRATGRKFYGSEHLANNMPRATYQGGQIHFFKVGKWINKHGPLIEAKRRGFSAMANPHSLAAYNAKHPEFADTHPNATTWPGDEQDEVCYAAFRRWHGRRDVDVSQGGNVWFDDWWLAAVV